MTGADLDAKVVKLNHAIVRSACLNAELLLERQACAAVAELLDDVAQVIARWRIHAHAEA